MQQSSTAITENGKVTERFTRYSDNEIVYRFTVEDSDLYSQAWTAELSFYAIDGQLYEYACHEGNHGLQGILAGWRRYESMGLNGDGSPKSETGTVAIEE